jgi:hypothetical protein
MMNFLTSSDRKLHKRRIDMIEPLIDQLSPQHYLSTLKQLTYHLGETYHHMYEVKSASKEEQKTPQEIQKLNYLIAKGVKYYRLFQSYYLNKDKSRPSKLDEGSERAYLLSCFGVAFLYPNT